MKHYDSQNYTSQNNLGYLLKINHSLMHDFASHIFASHDVSFIQWLALRKLKEGLAFTASDLCRKMMHDNGALTRIIDQLEEKGYIERQRSSEDRRVVNLQITAAGVAKVEELTPLLVDNFNLVLESFSAQEFADLNGLLNKLKNCLQESISESLSAPKDSL